MFTFWDYKFNRWERDGGLRIDHILVSPSLTERLQDVGVDRDVRGQDGASDHAPVWVELREAARRGPGRRAQHRGSSTQEGGEAADPAGAPKGPRAPLLALDGDNFAHRAYHAVPKTIRRADGKGAGAIVGFANILVRFHDTEKPRAIIVGWDSLETPNRRRELFPPYQSGRQFDDELIEQLNLLPELVAACGFKNAKAPGFEADDFLAAATAAEEQAGGVVLVASGDRDAFQLASKRATILYPVRAGEVARIGPDEVRERYGSTRNRFPTSLRYAATLPTRSPAPSEWDRSGRVSSCADTRPSRASSRPASSRCRRERSVSIGRSPRWTRRRPCPRSPIRSRHGTPRPTSCASGASSS